MEFTQMNDEELREFVRSRSNAELTNILTNRRARRPQSRRHLASAFHLRPRHSRRVDKTTESGQTERLAMLAPLVAGEMRMPGAGAIAVAALSDW